MEASGEPKRIVWTSAGLLDLVDGRCNLFSMLQIVGGVIRSSRVLVKLEAGLAHGVLHAIHAIIVHQTDSESARATLNSYESGRDGNGTHLLIDKDGTIYQTARLDQKCWHIGKIKARCFEEHRCTGTEKAFYDDLLKSSRGRYSNFVTKGYAHEMKKKYPDRFPTNEDSLGIELVGKKLGAADDSAFEKPTDRQQSSLQWMIGELLETLHLQRTDIFRHPQVSRKSSGEAADAKF